MFGNTVVLATVISPGTKLRSVNQTSNGFVAKIPTITMPVGDAGTATGASVFDLGGTDAKPLLEGRSLIKIKPYAIATNNNTFSMRVIGWSQAIAGSKLWVPEFLVEVACTCSGTYPGIVGQDVLDTELFCDTLVITYGDLNANSVSSPTTDAGIGNIICDLKGNQKFEATFTTGGSATSCNGLWSLYS